MERKIAILRGINVGGKRKLPMADLITLFNKLGYKNVQTYIQSGNVLFNAPASANDAKIARSVEKRIKLAFDYDVPVIVRSKSDMEQSLASNPFYASGSDIDKLHLTFLKEEPAKDLVAALNKEDHRPDEFRVNGCDVFIYCQGKYHQSKLTNNFMEGRLKVGATTRNWKTVLKLVELIRDESFSQ